MITKEKPKIFRYVTRCYDPHNIKYCCPFWHNYDDIAYCIAIDRQPSDFELESERFPDCPLTDFDIITKLMTKK